jgi:hypothetical protein
MYAFGDPTEYLPNKQSSHRNRNAGTLALLLHDSPLLSINYHLLASAAPVHVSATLANLPSNAIALSIE